MFEKLNAPDNVLAMRMSGKLAGEDIKKYMEILHQELGKKERINLCIDFNDLSDMNANAFMEGMEADFEFLKHIERFCRLAFISDKDWPGIFMDMGKTIFPTLEMKLFRSDQRDEAIKWAADLPEKPKCQAPALKRINTDSEEVFAFEMDGIITPEDFHSFGKEFNEFLESRDKVRLLNRGKDFCGIDPSVFLESGLVSMKISAILKVDRYAIVGAPLWMRKIVEKVNPIFKDIDMRTFDADQEDEAWEWIGAKPVE